MSRNNRRYRDLKRQISQPSPQQTLAKDELGQVLDNLNAWGFLEDQQQADHRDILCFGPGVFRGYLPVTWAGVTLWHKPRGYYFYDTLGMLGIWAVRPEPGVLRVLVGTRQLSYALPFFNPESYYRRIQQEFRTFYQDNGSPPPDDQCRYSVTYDAACRLEMRRAIEDEIIRWASEQHTAGQGW
ncbi:MAG: hypothetical protein CL610_24295 [Anaerolineaceae bacterium]|nr:hypothetical protein [Anaerolineaceae bacterium]